MERKWKENEKIEKDLLSTFPHFPLISSFSIHFLYQKLSHFVAIKCGTFVTNVKKMGMFSSQGHLQDMIIQ